MVACCLIHSSRRETSEPGNRFFCFAFLVSFRMTMRLSCVSTSTIHGSDSLSERCIPSPGHTVKMDLRRTPQSLVIFFFLTLQYSIGFAIYQHESATGIHVFPILNPPPSLYHLSGSSQCTSPKHPVSGIKPGLATRFIYDIIHVSMPFSQIIPLLPLPQSPKDCSIHQCLFCCLVYWVIVTIFLNSIYMR